jgi:hypothetical protein
LRPALVGAASGRPYFFAAIRRSSYNWFSSFYRTFRFIRLIFSDHSSSSVQNIEHNRDGLYGISVALFRSGKMVTGKSSYIFRRSNFMKTLAVVILLAGLTQSGCQFLGGAATGALATGAGYEIQSKRQMDKLEDDYKSHRISREEYESRKRQIESGSIVY